jgi:hypothetical protein
VRESGLLLSEEVPARMEEASARIRRTEVKASGNDFSLRNCVDRDAIDG